MSPFESCLSKQAGGEGGVHKGRLVGFCVRDARLPLTSKLGVQASDAESCDVSSAKYFSVESTGILSINSTVPKVQYRN